jgi:hypothetical protein
MVALKKPKKEKSMETKVENQAVAAEVGDVDAGVKAPGVDGGGVPLAKVPISIRDHNIVGSKKIRVWIDGVIQELRMEMAGPDGGSAERTLSLRRLQEAVMWLGMDLKERGAANPYPNSKDPSNAVVDPTAEGMKL